MEIKKNPKKDLNRDSGLHFVLGMFLVLMLTYVALEWKTFNNSPDYDISMNQVDELNEEVDLVEWIKPEPPKPIVTPPIIEIIDDVEEQEETLFDAVEPNQDTEIADIEDIEVGEDPVPDTVIFTLIEEVPVFPGCENSKDKRACFNKMMKTHIQKNFRYPALEQEMGIEGKVNIMFEIQKDGNIGNIRMRGPNKNLENDAARIIGKLPKMTPGKQRGTPVRVPFSIPITYKLQ